MTAAAAAVNDLSVCGIATDQLAPFSNEPCAWSSDVQQYQINCFYGCSSAADKHNNKKIRGLQQSRGSLWAARGDEMNTKAQH